MRLEPPERGHLTYCTNIHAGESWPEVRAALARNLPEVRQVAPGRPFGVGLRLSAVAAEALGEPGARDELKALLAANDCYVFTINGFPYGTFHGRPVKEAVYQPDWRHEERLTYSDRLAGRTVAAGPRSTEIWPQGHPKGQFRALSPLASTIAPYLQMINYRGRFSPIGGI